MLKVSFKSAVLAALVLMNPIYTWGKTVKYELSISQKPMNLSGKKTVDFALVVNGGIPAPTQEFK